MATGIEERSKVPLPPRASGVRDRAYVITNAEFRRINLLFRGIHLSQVLYSAAINIF